MLPIYRVLPIVVPSPLVLPGKTATTSPACRGYAASIFSTRSFRKKNETASVAVYYYFVIGGYLLTENTGDVKGFGLVMRCEYPCPRQPVGHSGYCHLAQISLKSHTSPQSPQQFQPVFLVQRSANRCCPVRQHIAHHPANVASRR